jgi:hypothetical protein
MLQYYIVGQLLCVHGQTLNAGFIIPINTEYVFNHHRIGSSLQPSLPSIDMHKVSQKYTSRRMATHSILNSPPGSVAEGYDGEMRALQGNVSGSDSHGGGKQFV